MLPRGQEEQGAGGTQVETKVGEDRRLEGKTEKNENVKKTNVYLQAMAL